MGLNKNQGARSKRNRNRPSMSSASSHTLLDSTSATGYSSPRTPSTPLSANAREFTSAANSREHESVSAVAVASRASPSGRVMWIDLEMTDIHNVSTGRIMEVGVIFTGPTFELLDGLEEEEDDVEAAAAVAGAGEREMRTRVSDGYPASMYHRVIRLSPEDIAASSQWSKSVHSAIRPHANQSLFDMCLTSPFSLDRVEDDLVRLVGGHAEGRPIMLAGSSVACDRVFIDHHMPRLSSLLHHRMIDVSTVLEMTRRMYPGFKPHVPRLRRTNHAHSAMADIVASLRLMHELQHTVFMPMIFEYPCSSSRYQHTRPPPPQQFSTAPPPPPPPPHHFRGAAHHQHHHQQQHFPHHTAPPPYTTATTHHHYREPDSNEYHYQIRRTAHPFQPTFSTFPPPTHHTTAEPPLSHSHSTSSSSIVRQSYRFPAYVFEKYLGESRNPYATHG